MVNAVPLKHLNIAAIGDEDLVSGLRLAGLSRYYVVKGNNNPREEVRKVLTELISQPDIGIVVILEDYAKHVKDLITQLREGRRVTPIIIEAPSKLGTKYKDVAAYYKKFIRESIGFDIKI